MVGHGNEARHSDLSLALTQLTRYTVLVGVSALIELPNPTWATNEGEDGIFSADDAPFFHAPLFFFHPGNHPRPLFSCFPLSH